MKHRLAFLVVALGCWLVALPLTFESRGPVVISDILSGFLCIIFGILSLSSARIWSGWAIGIVGVWLEMAPLLFWAPQSWMYINDTLAGAIAIVLSFSLARGRSLTNVAT